MTGIEDYPDVDEVEDWVNQTIEQLALDFAQTFGVPEEVLQRIETREILVTGRWGRGTAEPGETPLELTFIVNVQDADTEGSDIYNQAVNPILDDFDTDATWRGITVDPPSPQMATWFDGIELHRSVWPLERIDEAINYHLQREEPQRLYSLTTRDIITTREVVPDTEDMGLLKLQNLLSPDEFAQVQSGEAEPEEFIEGRIEAVRIPEDEYREEKEEETEEEEGPEPEPEPLPTEEPLFPEKDEFMEDMPPVLTPFAIDEDSLEVPAGKETKQVEPREMYPFEVAMGHDDPEMPRDYPELHGFEEGVGFEMAMGTIGETVPPANVPRTGLYIKNRLYYEGPAYVLELYRDLVLYSAYISSLHQMRFKPGTYESFRNFIGRIYNYGSGGELIERLSQQQAASQGFQTIPDHPSLEGEKAPWLERRQYYRIVEDNFDNGVWYNITEAIYGEPNSS